MARMWIGGGKGDIDIPTPALPAPSSYDPPYVFVLRPGDPLGARQNVYLDSTSLWNAASLVSGSKRIEVDGSLAPVNWLADGVQDLSGVEFFSSQEALQGYTLNLDDGVQWTFTTLYVNGVFIESNSNSPVFTLNLPGGFAFLFIYLEGSVWSNTATAMVLVEAGEFSTEVSDLGNIGDGTHPTIKTVAPGSFQGIFVDGSELEVGALDPTSTGTATISYDAGSPPGSQAPLTPTLSFIDTAPDVGYTPATPADWTSPPTQTAQAIDRLVAVLANHVSVRSIANFGPAATVTIELGVAGMPASPADFTTTTGKVRVMVTAHMLAQDGGDLLTFTLVRNGSPIGPPQSTTVGGGVGISHTSKTIIFDDNPGPGTYTWGIEISDTTAGHFVEVPAGQVAVTLQELQ